MPRFLACTLFLLGRFLESVLLEPVRSESQGVQPWFNPWFWHSHSPIDRLLERVLLAELDLGIVLVASDSETVSTSGVVSSLVTGSFGISVTQNAVSFGLSVGTKHEIVLAGVEEHGSSGRLEFLEVLRNLEERWVGDGADRNGLVKGVVKNVSGLNT
jgi:hypothetical protein